MLTKIFDQNLLIESIQKIKVNLGQSLIELLIAIGLASILLPALFWGLIISSSSKAQETQSLQANSLLKEAAEAVRSVREANWNNIATNGIYHPVISVGSWSLVSGAETINQYQRTIIISDAFRDSSGSLISSGGTSDPSTKLITISLSWNTPSPTTLSSSFYLTRYFNNQAILQPVPNQFNIYSADGSSNVAVNEKSVTLNGPSSGNGDWCSQTPKVVSSLASGEIISAMSATTINTTPPSNWAYLGTGGNQYDYDLITVNITDPPGPSPSPSASVASLFSNNYETNDVFGEQNYAYTATNFHNKQVVIFSITPSSIAETGHVALPTSPPATGVFVIGNTGYVVAGNFLYTFDLSSRNGRRNVLGQFQLLGNAKKLYVVNTGQGIFAFIAMNSTSNQLEVVDVSDPVNMALAALLTVNGQAGKDIFASSDGLRAYLVTSYSATQPEFFIIDSSNIFNKTPLPPPIGTYSLGSNAMNPRAVKMVLSKNRAIIVGEGGSEQYVVLNTSIETSPTRCSGMAIAGGSAFAVATILEADGDTYAYIATSDKSNQFQIIEGGPGNQNPAQGVYESTTFDTLANVSFNRLQAVFNQPPGTKISFQVAVAQSNVFNNCNGVTFLYQNLNNVTTQTAGQTTSLTGVIPYMNLSSYQNPGRCFRYRATLTASPDLMSAPTLQNIKINYTP